MPPSSVTQAAKLSNIVNASIKFRARKKKRPEYVTDIRDAASDRSAHQVEALANFLVRRLRPNLAEEKAA